MTVAGRTASRSKSKRIGRVESPELWVQLARSMRNHDRSYQAISDSLGVSYRRVYKALNSERVEEWDATAPSRRTEAATRRRRAQRARKAPDCSVCGKPLSKPPEALPPVCAECRQDGGCYEPPEWYFEALDLWAEGLDSKEIGARVGKSSAQVLNLLSKLRRRGWVIPYRGEVLAAISQGVRAEIVAPPHERSSGYTPETQPERVRRES